MNNEKEINQLHNKGFVIIRASQTTNAPIGWKNKQTGKWGYVDQMNDPNLIVYKNTFDASLIASSHCGFYLGHNHLCCIDLDTKKTTIEQTSELRDECARILKNKIAIERTKSNGFHIYFRYKERLPNNPNFMGLGVDNWIEIYYSKRFIACYLSRSKRYKLEHGSILSLPILTKGEHAKLIALFAEYKGKEKKQPKKSKPKKVDQEAWNQAESYTKQIEDQGLDITGDNPTWFKIGKALANAFGNKGFDLFNRISQFSPKYNADTIEDDYSKFVQYDYHDRDKKITIASFFKMCIDAGLKSIETLNSLKLHPVASTKEFELPITKKDSMAERVHTLVMTFKSHIEICCIDKGSFFVYDTTHWMPKNPRQIVDLLKDFINRSEVDDSIRKTLYTLPYLEMALRELALITMKDSIEPYTGNLKDGIFVNMENGVLYIDLKNGKRKLLDHEPKYNFTTLLPFNYSPADDCPRFNKWLDTQMPTRDSQIAYYAFVASCLTRHKADIIMLLAGETSTGKSSLIDITRRIVGLENSVAISAGILFGGTSDAQAQAIQMENKLLAYDFDSQPFKHLELLLKVAAGEPIPGWKMNIARRPVVNYGRVIVGMNPYNYSVFNPAVARRFITINMDVKIVKDNSVMPAIYENEMPGIFNHVLNIGVKHLIENGGQIKQTESIKKATVDFHMSNRDSIRWFDSKYLVLKQSNDKSNKYSAFQKLQRENPKIEIIFTSIGEMYNQFRIWMEDSEGYTPGKIQLRKHFAADLKLIGIEDQVVKHQGLGIYVGLKK